MHRSILTVVALSALSASLAIAAGGETPTVNWDGAAAALGVGIKWGSGTLHYGGYDYPFEINGLDLADLGVSKVTGSGDVYNLSRVEDLSGNYAGAGVGLTVAAGGSAAIVQNQNGVRIELVSTNQGLRAWLGPDAISVNVPESSIAAVRALQSAEKSAARAENAADHADSAASRMEEAVQRLEQTVARAERRPRRGSQASETRPSS